jgi:hypothetical protein
MSLSKPVEEALAEAQGYLRNALHLAAKNERPMICQSIADLISRIESLKNTEQLMDQLEKYKPGNNDWFFGRPFGK